MNQIVGYVHLIETLVCMNVLNVQTLDNCVLLTYNDNCNTFCKKEQYYYNFLEFIKNKLICGIGYDIIFFNTD